MFITLNKCANYLASSPGHSQILSHSRGENREKACNDPSPDFSPWLRDKSGSGLGMRLLITLLFQELKFIKQNEINVETSEQ